MQKRYIMLCSDSLIHTVDWSTAFTQSVYTTQETLSHCSYMSRTRSVRIQGTRQLCTPPPTSPNYHSQRASTTTKAKPLKAVPRPARRATSPLAGAVVFAGVSDGEVELLEVNTDVLDDDEGEDEEDEEVDKYDEVDDDKDEETSDVEDVDVDEDELIEDKRVDEDDGEGKDDAFDVDEDEDVDKVRDKVDVADKDVAVLMASPAFAIDWNAWKVLFPVVGAFTANTIPCWQCPGCLQ